jgi:hypothetical protein
MTECARLRSYDPEEVDRKGIVRSPPSPRREEGEMAAYREPIRFPLTSCGVTLLQTKASELACFSLTGGMQRVSHVLNAVPAHHTNHNHTLSS